jgi:hypothetical protein
MRMKKGVSIEAIAASTRIAVELLEGLERNDFSNWPCGIFARSYIRQYAAAVDADPEGTVDDFCRWFPQGDRRAERVLREHAAIVGHELVWSDDAGVLPPGGDRRGRGPETTSPPPPPQSPFSALFMRLRRAFGAFGKA